ncbi:hypothetical protein ACLOJK_011122 [Asimina triloba]
MGVIELEARITMAADLDRDRSRHARYEKLTAHRFSAFRFFVVVTSAIVMQTLRSVEKHLGLEKLYVLGTNCVDNGTRKGLDKFLKAASSDPETVLHYEFMQDYKVHLKHLDGHIEEVPYFCLPANQLVDVIAPSCYRQKCNIGHALRETGLELEQMLGLNQFMKKKKPSLSDSGFACSLVLVIVVEDAVYQFEWVFEIANQKLPFNHTLGQNAMNLCHVGVLFGTLFDSSIQFHENKNAAATPASTVVDPFVPHYEDPFFQLICSRNERGREMLSLVENLLEITPTVGSKSKANMQFGHLLQGNRRPFVVETVKADDKAKSGTGPEQPAPKFVGDLIAFLLNLIGPKGLEFARYSLDYHTIRNYLHVQRRWGKQRADQHTPSYAKKIVDMYNGKGEVNQMLSTKR